MTEGLYCRQQKTVLHCIGVCSIRALVFSPLSLDEAIVVIAINISYVQSILNGTTAIPHSHPWLLNLKARSWLWPILGDWHICGASLIQVPYLSNASDIVITAAHCVDRRDQHWAEDAYEYIVRASDHDQEQMDKGEVIVEVVRIIFHPKYDPAIISPNDIAILKLVRPLEFSETIKPIKLPADGRDEGMHDSECTVAGWGHTTFTTDLNQERSGARTRLLQQIDVDQILSDPWACAYICKDYEPKTEICSGVTFGRSALMGDSGSPLVCLQEDERVLFGIVSVGHYTPEILLGTTYVKVSSYHDWIRMQIEDLNQIRQPCYDEADLTKHVTCIFTMILLLCAILQKYLSSNKRETF